MKNRDSYAKSYTNMCMIYTENAKLLVQNRAKSDWPGLTFPGGHIKENEDPLDAIKREVFEETNLEIDNIEEVGEFIWYNDDKEIIDIALLYRTKTFKGEIISSEEGEVFFTPLKDINKYPFSTDFDKVLERMLNEPYPLFKKER